MRTVDTLKEEQTRAEIVGAAQKLFQKYGLDKTPMEDIALPMRKSFTLELNVLKVVR